MGYWNDKRIEMSELVGKTFTEVKQEDVAIVFIEDTGQVYEMRHDQDCCESVYIEDLNGDLQDLVGTPITLSEEVSNEAFEKVYEEKFVVETEYGDKKSLDGDYYPKSHTWTFYKLATIKGYVDIRWFGTSNGYYSESVNLNKIMPEDNE